MDRTVYLDNNATTRVAPEVRDAMLPFFCERYGNPSSMHAFGGSVAKDVAAAREEVARFLNADPDEIVFTSCATESDNAAIRGTAGYFGKSLKVVTTAVEHPAVLQPCRRLKALGYDGVIERMERFAFYERAKKAYAVVVSGETAKYGNVILKKGVTPVEKI